MKQKVIIIGAGLGGLFTGAILSKEGFEVTLLEKNAVIGGGLQTFQPVPIVSISRKIKPIIP